MYPSRSGIAAPFRLTDGPRRRYSQFRSSSGLNSAIRETDDDPTALMDAAEAGSVECLDLLQAGANPSLSANGQTAADLALFHGHRREKQQRAFVAACCAITFNRTVRA